MENMGSPQKHYMTVRVAGTNGKSSTSRFLAAFLQAHGFKTGLYLSPLLMRYPDCIEIDGKVIHDDRFANAVISVNESIPLKNGQPIPITEFELLTAAALMFFSEECVDIAIVEVGMGGRWDATSIVSPVVSVVTGVDYDHLDLLGSSLKSIAAQKAAIITSSSIAILGPGTLGLQNLFLDKVEEAGTTAWIVREQGHGDIKIESDAACVTQRKIIEEGMRNPSLVSHSIDFAILASPLPTKVCFTVKSTYGTYPELLFNGPLYQVQNISCAIAASEAVLCRALDVDALRATIESTVLPGRFELLQQDPVILVDAAHNPQSSRHLALSLQERFLSRKNHVCFDDSWVLLLGILENKDADGILEHLLPLFNRVLVSQSSSCRAIPADTLACKVSKASGKEPMVIPRLEEAIEYLKNLQCNIVATGSITVAGEVKRVLEI